MMENWKLSAAAAEKKTLNEALLHELVGMGDISNFFPRGFSG